MVFFYVNNIWLKIDNNNEIRNVKYFFDKFLLIIILNGLLKIDIKEKENKDEFMGEMCMLELKVYVNEH